MNDKEMLCSFCGKSGRVAKKLISNPNGDCYICDECVDICKDIIKENGYENYKFYVLHSDNEKGAMELKEMLIQNKIEEKNIEICPFSSVVSVHVGMKCLAIQHIEEIQI